MTIIGNTIFWDLVAYFHIGLARFYSVVYTIKHKYVQKEHFWLLETTQQSDKWSLRSLIIVLFTYLFSSGSLYSYIRKKWQMRWHKVWVAPPKNEFKEYKEVLEIRLSSLIS